jgi:hypothetical protein
VQTFAKIHEEKKIPVTQIVSYALTENDYKNFFNEIDPQRIRYHSVSYDPSFIDKYLFRMPYLCECLKKGVFPDAQAERNGQSSDSWL